MNLETFLFFLLNSKIDINICMNAIGFQHLRYSAIDTIIVGVLDDAVVFCRLVIFDQGRNVNNISCARKYILRFQKKEDNFWVKTIRNATCCFRT